jgi:hypothetical protein
MLFLIEDLSQKSWQLFLKGKETIKLNKLFWMIMISESCISPSKGVEGVLYGGKLFMKKKLVSILLSLSMCAAYALPLTSVAANNDVAEDVVVEETAAPAAKEQEKTVETVSSSIFEISTAEPTGSSIKMEYGDTFEVTKDNLFQIKTNNTDYKPGGTQATAYNNTLPSVELALSTDSKYLELQGNKITVKALSGNRGAVPVIVTLGFEKGGVNYYSQLKYNVSIDQKDLSKVDPEDIVASYTAAKDNNKIYKNLDVFKSKYKGASGFEASICGKALVKKNDIKKIEAAPEGEKSGDYYLSPYQNTVTGGAVSTTASITVTGKGNYKNSFTITGQGVNLQPQRLNAGTISGATVTFGSIVNILDGFTTDDFKEIVGSDGKEKETFFKYTTKSKNIKIVAKKGTVSVKKVVGKETDDVAKITVSSKKNPKCKIDVDFKLAPMDISTGSAFGRNMFDTTGVYGKNKNKVYKNFVEFDSKFMGKNKKGTGLALKYPNPADTNKKITLKVNKDYKVTFTPNGTKSNKEASGKLQPTAYYTEIGGKTYVATTGTLVVEGTGNYSGVITDDAFVVPLQYQSITASSLEATSGCL